MSEHEFRPIASGSVAGFLDGAVRAHRSPLAGLTEAERSVAVARLPEGRRATLARHEARVAAAAELMGDLVAGRAPAFLFREAIAPSSPETARLIEANYPGILRRAGAHEVSWRGAGVALEEAMSVSDFPLLMGDVMDRSLLARFAEVPQVWRQYVDVGSPLTDFRTVRMLSTTGGNEAWETISDLEGITYTAIAESGITMEPALYGKAMRLSWRLMMNDDLDAFRVIPAALAQGGRRTLNKFATDLLFDASGPDASIFTTGKGNRLSGNPALSVTSLGAAIAALLAFTDSTGEPINVEGVRLVYGPGLHVTVQNLLNTLSYDATTSEGAATNRTIRVNNWLTTGITPVMDPYIPLVATTANAATSWIVTTNPSAGRPLARVRFLRGFESPALYQKAPNTQRVGGGLDADVGDFQSMASEFKGLMAFGGVAIEDKAGVASNWSGS
jgi:hypothetical protein